MSIAIALNRTSVVAAVAVGIVGYCGYALFISKDQTPAHDLQTMSADVKRVISGNKFKIDPEGHVVLAGVRAPYKNEPLADESTQRLRELLDDEKVRLRFDEEKKDKDGQWIAYAFADGECVNERLVRDGMAYARLKRTERRFARELLDAQGEARREHRGLWALRPNAPESTYVVDQKHGTFHRPNCADVPNIKPDARLDVNTVSSAYDQGFAPCTHCNP